MTIQEISEQIVEEFSVFDEWLDKYEYLIETGKQMPATLMQRIVEVLPECPPFFDKDQLTDKPERFFVNEIIREKILLNYDKEIPYSVEVEVESFKEEAAIIRIGAVIYVERDSQKGILIGRAGAALKKVGSDARRDLETFFGKKIFLELVVKVDKDWRQKSSRLKHYGYDLT